MKRVTGREKRRADLVHAAPAFAGGHYAVVACEAEEEAGGEGVAVDGAYCGHLKRADQLMSRVDLRTRTGEEE